jgi:hypothetical protein
MVWKIIEPNFENVKKSPGFWSLQREMPETLCSLTGRPLCLFIMIISNLKSFQPFSLTPIVASIGEYIAIVLCLFSRFAA